MIRLDVGTPGRRLVPQNIPSPPWCNNVQTDHCSCADSCLKISPLRPGVPTSSGEARVRPGVTDHCSCTDSCLKISPLRPGVTTSRLIIVPAPTRASKYPLSAERGYFESSPGVPTSSLIIVSAPTRASKYPLSALVYQRPD